MLPFLHCIFCICVHFFKKSFFITSPGSILLLKKHDTILMRQGTKFYIVCNRCLHELMQRIYLFIFNKFTASFENAISLSVPGVPAPCEKFPHSSLIEFWKTFDLLNRFSISLVCFGKHWMLFASVCNINLKTNRLTKRVIRSDKPITSYLHVLS
jgi:hypothetical protein